MVSYVAGFLFCGDADTASVALISKIRPKWQVGKLNGVGGKIEEGEDAASAMRREWVEETATPNPQWRHFATLKGAEFVVVFFTARGGESYPAFFVNDTDEKVNWYPVSKLHNLPVIPNLRWLIPLALDKDAVVATITDPS